MFYFSEDKPKKKAIPKAVKITVWNKYVGADKTEGKCYVCGRTIHISDFDCGHNKARAKGGGTNIVNLRPLCRTCNTSMQTTSIETFKARHFDKPKAHQADALKSLTIKQLKFLADKHQISIKGKVEGNILVGYTKKAPTKQQYINKLSHVVSGADLRAIPKEAKQTVKKPVKN